MHKQKKKVHRRENNPQAYWNGSITLPAWGDKKLKNIVITSYSIHYTKLYDKIEKKAMDRSEEMIERVDGIEKWAIDIPCY